MASVSGLVSPFILYFVSPCYFSGSLCVVTLIFILTVSFLFVIFTHFSINGFSSWINRQLLFAENMFFCLVSLLRLVFAAHSTHSLYFSFFFFGFERKNSMNLHCLKYQVKSVTEARSLAG